MRVALITGGSRGIGRALVEEFARERYRVAFTYVSNEQAAQEVQAGLESEGLQALALRCDVRDFEAVTRLVEEVEESLGPVHVLVNNAGVRRDGAFFRMTPEAWQEAIETNLSGAFHCCRAVVPGMMRRGGVILNMTSAAGIVGMAGQANYCAAKAGLIGLTKALAQELARLDVRVNAIAPGYIDSGMTDDLNPVKRKKLLSRVPAGRMGEARQVARLAVYLAGDDASYITGKAIPIDGGLV